MPNVFNKGKILDKKLYEGTDFNDDEDDEGTDDERVIYTNPSYSAEKKESCYEKSMKRL